MAQLNAEKAVLENKLTTALNPGEIADTGRQLKAVGTALEALEAQWLDWSEELQLLENVSYSDSN